MKHNLFTTPKYKVIKLTGTNNIAPNFTKQITNRNEI